MLETFVWTLSGKMRAIPSQFKVINVNMFLRQFIRNSHAREDSALVFAHTTSKGGETVAKI